MFTRVNLLAPRPRDSSLRVERAHAMLEARPLAIEEALDQFIVQWESRQG